MDTTYHTNHIQLHALDHAGQEPTLIFMPGLTANAHSFDGVIQAGLAPRFRVIALDMRGRAGSDKPLTGYRLTDHAADVLGVLDAENIEQGSLIGHSFGGLLSMYMAATFPERIARLVIIDAAKSAADPQTVAMIRPSLNRLGRILPSVSAYMQAMKQMPFLNGYWDDALEAYYRADVRENEDGTAQSQSTAAAINQVIDGILAEPWDNLLPRIHQPTLLVNGTAPFGPEGSPPLISAAAARETVRLLANARYAHVPGNHLTMLFGENAAITAQTIIEFING